jgi:hypothetical protein
MSKELNKKSGIVGVSGEFFVAAELSQRGIVATLTLKNTPSIDIIATNLEKGTVANIQVKTMSIGNKNGWRLGPKDEEPSNIMNHYYVLVDLQGLNKMPEYTIIPKKEFASFINKSHRDWLSIPKKDGNPRKDTDIRVFNPNINKECKKFAEKYRDNWNILKLG